MKINQQSKYYLLGVTFIFIALFVISATLFLFIVSDDLKTLVSQSPKIMYTYFLSIANRVLLFLAIFGLIPLTIYQLRAKEKSSFDNTISGLSLVIIFIVILTFLGSEYYYLKKYENGELFNSPMFSTPTIETRIFDKIIK